MGADNYQHPFFVYDKYDEAGKEARRFFIIPPELRAVVSQMLLVQLYYLNYTQSLYMHSWIMFMPLQVYLLSTSNSRLHPVIIPPEL